MGIKKTVSFQEYVLMAAEQKAKELFGGSLSNYLSFLICKDNKGKIDDFLLEEEMRKPEKITDINIAEFDNICRYCGKKIKTGDEICGARFGDGTEKFVHRKCCR